MRQIDKSFSPKALRRRRCRCRQQCATRLRHRRAIGGSMPACLPACLLVGTSTGSWTKRELPLASSLCQHSAPRRAAPHRSAPRRAGAKGIEYPAVFSRLFFPFLSIFLPSYFIPLVILSSGIAHPRKKNLEETLDMCKFATSLMSRK